MTPFNTSQMDSTVTSTKKFDLQASLAKPISWKPHLGKLKTFGDSGALSSHRVDVKAVKTKTRFIQLYVTCAFSSGMVLLLYLVLCGCF